MATARGRLTARLARLVDAPPPLDDAERFAAHLATEFPAVFLFLWDPSLDATNWRAEQAIRPAVVIRKVCGGNRTRHGADTQQVLASVVRTARQRNLDLPPLIAGHASPKTTKPVRPDGGHDLARRDRTHRDLEENRQMLTDGLVYESVVDFAADSPRRGLLNPPRGADGEVVRPRPGRCAGSGRSSMVARGCRRWPTGCWPSRRLTRRARSA